MTLIYLLSYKMQRLTAPSGGLCLFICVFVHLTSILKKIVTKHKYLLSETHEKTFLNVSLLISILLEKRMWAQI